MNNSKNREWNADLVLGPSPERSPSGSSVHRRFGSGRLHGGGAPKRNPVLLPMIPKA